MNLNEDELSVRTFRQREKLNELLLGALNEKKAPSFAQRITAELRKALRSRDGELFDALALDLPKNIPGSPARRTLLWRELGRNGGLSQASDSDVNGWLLRLGPPSLEAMAYIARDSHHAPWVEKLLVRIDDHPVSSLEAFKEITAVYTRPKPRQELRFQDLEALDSEPTMPRTQALRTRKNSLAQHLEEGIGAARGQRFAERDASIAALLALVPSPEEAAELMRFWADQERTRKVLDSHSLTGVTRFLEEDMAVWGALASSPDHAWKLLSSAVLDMKVDKNNSPGIWAEIDRWWRLNTKNLPSFLATDPSFVADVVAFRVLSASDADASLGTAALTRLATAPFTKESQTRNPFRDLALELDRLTGPTNDRQLSFLGEILFRNPENLAASPVKEKDTALTAWIQGMEKEEKSIHRRVASSLLSRWSAPERQQMWVSAFAALSPTAQLAHASSLFLVPDGVRSWMLPSLQKDVPVDWRMELLRQALAGELSPGNEQNKSLVRQLLRGSSWEEKQTLTRKAFIEWSLPLSDSKKMPRMASRESWKDWCDIFIEELALSSVVVPAKGCLVPLFRVLNTVIEQDAFTRSEEYQHRIPLVVALASALAERTPRETLGAIERWRRSRAEKAAITEMDSAGPTLSTRLVWGTPSEVLSPRLSGP